MKKSTGSILLLSAFAAMVLAGCGTEGNSSSTPAAGSSETAVSANEGNSASADAGNSNSTADTTADSSSAAPSSTPAVETDWSNKNFIGEYKGGMTSLVINTDKTTSWGTSTDKFPATYTDLGGGVTMIKSTSEVADQDYVEIITDGNMAYVLHNKDAMDYYVMDKDALGSATIAFAETADEETFFGGIDIEGHWKYFACIDGTYHFGVSITIQAGTNINSGGAIFDYGSGATKKSYKVTYAPDSATAFARIEQTNFTATSYTGDHGELTIGTDDDGLVFATLNGVALEGAVLSADGSELSIPNGSAPTSFDTTDPAGPMKVVATTTYTLAKIAHTYVEGEGTMKTPLFGTISGATGTYTAETDGSGNIWVVYVATESGTLQLDETTKNIHDSYIQVFDSTAPNYTSGSNAIGYNDNVFNEVTLGVTVIAGHSYIIKLGAYSDISKNYTDTTSTYSGLEEGFDWSFTAFTHDIYTGDSGNLDLLMDGTTVKAVTLDGNALAKYTKDGNSIQTVLITLDASNPADVVITTTTTTLTIDPTAKTYTIVSTPVESHPFHTLAETDTAYSGVTGNDGNMWASFTPTSSGSITIEATSSSYNTTYIQVFEYDPATGVAGLTSSGSKLLASDNAYSGSAKVTVTVRAGVTYIIKQGVFSGLDTLPGETLSSSYYIGVNESLTFSYVDYLMQSYTGAEGDLVIASKDGAFKNATLDGDPIPGAITYDSDNGVLTVKGPQTLDMTNPDDPLLLGTNDVYTLDLVNNTYVKASVPGSEHFYHELTVTSTELTGSVVADGNLWATFTAPSEGLITVEELVSTSSDGYLQIFESTASSYTTSSTGRVGYADSGAELSGGGKISNLHVEAGHTYVIKAGAWDDRDKVIASASASSSAGKTETISFEYKEIVTGVYKNDSGDDLTIKTIDGALYSATLGTTAITDGTLSANGKTFSVTGAITNINSSNRLDPTATVTSTVYYLDKGSMTYEAVSETDDVHLFHEIDANDTSFTGTVGADGNLWGKFTATEDGYITVEETVSTSSDGYIAVYDSTAPAFTTSPSSNYLASADGGAKLTGAGKITKLAVQAGHTYIIKAGNYYDRDKVIGGTGTSTYSGKTETVAFTYLTPDHDTYTGAEGILDKISLEGTYMRTTLDGQPFNATPNADKTVYTSKTNVFDSTSMTVTTTEKTYTLGEGTYEVNTVSNVTDLLTGSWSDGNSGTYSPSANGSVIIAFTPTADGTYTFKVDAIAGTDIKIALYGANFNETGFQGNPLVYADDGYSGDGEEFTYDCTAGTTYYFRVCVYGDFSKALTNLTSTYTDKEFSVSIIAPVAPTPDPEPTDPTPTDPEPTTDPTPAP